MSLLTTHFSRAYSPRVALNSVTGFDSPESPGHQWPLSILLTAFLLVRSSASKLWRVGRVDLRVCRFPEGRSVKPAQPATRRLTASGGGLKKPNFWR